MGPEQTRVFAFAWNKVARDGINLFFLIAFTAAALVATHNNPPIATPHIASPVPPAKQTVAKIEKAPPAPSAFEIEQTMAPRDLLKRWDATVAEAAKRFDISQDWIRAVMRMESGGRTMLAEGQPITSTAGAMGLMQVMPETYAQMRAQYGLGSDPYNPHDNIYAGAAYLSWLHHRYGYPAMFAAYNDGPGALEDHLYRGRMLPSETQAYVAGIGNILGKAVGGLLHNTAHGFAMLTRPDGTALRVDKANVRAVRAALPGEYADNVQAVITIGKRRQGVRESVAEATAALS